MLLEQLSVLIKIVLVEATVNPDLKIAQMRSLGYVTFDNLVSNQLSNGLITASIGRADDRHFEGKVWIKDNVRAVKFALDPLFQEAFPELREPAIDLYLRAIKGVLRIQNQPEQIRRFQTRPGPAGSDSYHSLDDNLAPAIKFDRFGEIQYDWGHNQPDNWGTLLLEAGKGIAAGLPVLDPQTAMALENITSYVANLKTERLTCRSIWEHNPCWSSYSTRRIVLAGLDQMAAVWPEVERFREDSLITREQIIESANNLREYIREHFPADYTDSYNHLSAGDLASLVVLNDIELPTEEKAHILFRTRELENGQGFYRYRGDPWKKGVEEAKWTMGKVIMARHVFIEALSGTPLEPGLRRLDEIEEIIKTLGYLPELFEDRNNSGEYSPNNNELAWTAGYIQEALGAGIVALRQRSFSYN